MPAFQTKSLLKCARGGGVGVGVGAVLINDKSALVCVMAWHMYRTGDLSLHEPMLTLFTDVYMHPQGPGLYELRTKHELTMNKSADIFSEVNIFF